MGTLGRIVVLQGTTVIEEKRLSPCREPRCFQATLRLPPGFYEILVSYMDHRMGTHDEPGATPHWVELDEFFIRAKPVSQAEYDLFLLQERHETPYEQRTQYDLSKPAVYLTWNDAAEFCDWVTRQKNDGATYRLPTEAEYERAMRKKRPDLTYPWGNEELDRSEDPPLRHANYGKAGVEPGCCRSAHSRLSTACTISPAMCGHGHSDTYEDNYYSSPAARHNPQGPLIANMGSRFFGEVHVKTRPGI